MNAGHEVMLVDSWLAQCYWSGRECYWHGADSVGVQLNGNDNVLSNGIVFDYSTVVRRSTAVRTAAAGRRYLQPTPPVGASP